MKYKDIINEKKKDKIVKINFGGKKELNGAIKSLEKININTNFDLDHPFTLEAILNNSTQISDFMH